MSERVLVGESRHTYKWVEDWAQPLAGGADAGWAHPGLSVTPADEVITAHHRDPRLAVFDAAGRLIRTVDTELTESHGLTMSDGHIWIADNGNKANPDHGHAHESAAEGGRVVAMTMDGEVIRTLVRPPLDIYETTAYAPTSIAIDDRPSGTGDIWVADGYGASLVHRYSRHGHYVSTISGEEGGTRFNCPHGIWIDTRKPEPELYVADRGNRLVQVFDLEGRFRRALGPHGLSSPSAFARSGDDVIVAELFARLTVIDIDDRVVCHLGKNGRVCGEAGWPNMLNASGEPCRTDRLRAGLFNSPHGLGVDSRGNIYVSEWLIGGRIIKLERI